MRLYQIEDTNPVEQKKGALLSVLSMYAAKADSADKTLRMPMNSLAQLMQNLGFNIGYEEFDKIMQQDPQIKNIVQDYNQEYVFLGPEQIKQAKSNDPEKARETVKKMAKRAALRRNN